MRPTSGLLLLWVVTLVAAPAAGRDLSIAQVLAQPKTKQVMADLDRSRGWSQELLIRIGAIVAPSGQEHERAAAVKAEMERIGLRDVTMDKVPNVVGRIPGRSGKALVFVSTLDDLATVADHQRASGRPPRLQGTQIVGPGTNTSATTAAMLAAARALLRSGIVPEHDLVFAAVAQEETGLDGMRALYASYRDRAVAFVDILGDGESISYGALGIHWWRVTAKGPSGHTLRGGLPNVNQGIGRAVDRILSLPHPERNAASRTRLNVAILSSGKVFNHKPESGWFSLDIRSLDRQVISEIEAEVGRILGSVGRETGVSFEQTVENQVPGGQIPGARESTLVRWSQAIARQLGRAAKLDDAGSANMNVAIAGGTPAIGIGGERGGRRGFPDEWADTDTLHRMANHVALLAMTVGAGDRVR
jgi:acetylornithine deacetylase/succinyl-diaminopimelate desuccinylase-like protein